MIYDPAKRQMMEEIIQNISKIESEIDAHPYNLDLDTSLAFNDDELEKDEISFDQNEKELVEEFMNADIAIGNLQDALRKYLESYDQKLF